MKLSDEEQAMLAGEMGAGVAKAMEIVVALGNIYGAADLVALDSAHISGVSYKNIGDAGLEFLEEWVREGARVRCFTTLNPAGMDTEDWQHSDMQTAPAFAAQQWRVLNAFRDMGIDNIVTCTPYYVNNVPRRGDHVAFSESSAVVYANSRLGAYTNREGGPSALASAIVGRTARYGFHLDENRRADLVVQVKTPLPDATAFSVLGFLVGKIAQNRIPLLQGIEREMSEEDHKLAGAAMAAAGGVALYHVPGQTPEATERGEEIIAPHAEYITIDDLADGYRALGIKEGRVAIDWVNFGCPHVSLEEMRQIVDALDGRKIKTRMWVMVAPAVAKQAMAEGVAQRIKESGGELTLGACAIVAPMKQTGIRSVATNTAKGAFYHSSYNGLDIHVGNIAQCVEAAVTGIWAG